MGMTTTFRTVGCHLAAVLGGVIAAASLWIVGAIVLFWTGALGYALNTGAFVALLVGAAASPWIYLRTKRLVPQRVKFVLTFLIALLSVLVYVCVTIAVTQPHTVIFGNALFR
jgi:hypothetical protein